MDKLAPSGNIGWFIKLASWNGMKILFFYDKWLGGQKKAFWVGFQGKKQLLDELCGKLIDRNEMQGDIYYVLAAAWLDEEENRNYIKYNCYDVFKYSGGTGELYEDYGSNCYFGRYFDCVEKR